MSTVTSSKASSSLDTSAGQAAAWMELRSRGFHIATVQAESHFRLSWGLPVQSSDDSVYVQALLSDDVVRELEN